MGFENRDYFRDGSYTAGGGTFLADAPMCKRILIITVVVFLGQMFFSRPARVSDFQHQIDEIRQKIQEQQNLHSADIYYDGDEMPIEDPNTVFDPEQFIRDASPVSIVQDWLKLDTEKVLKKGQIWRLITSAFCHDRFGVWHIVFNMLFLVWFGRFVEATYGSREFLCFYLMAAVLASVAFIGLELFTGDRHGAIGASGAVMAVVCVFAMWNPHHTVRINFLFPIQIRYLLLFYVIFDLHPVLLALSGTVTHTGVAHAAHLGGLLFGYLYYKNNWRLLPYWNQIAKMFKGKDSGRPRTNSPNRNSQSGNDRPEPVLSSQRAEKTKADERFDQSLDEVLKKISESGQESLTEQEKKILMLGSKRYRKQ